MSQKRVLVVGATGNQGAAVIQALQPTDFAVRALIRPAASNQRRRTKLEGLRQQGVEIAEADLDDPGSLAKAMEGVWGVYSVVNFRDGGVQKEAERGKRLADVAKQAGVQHFVYSSVGGAERNSGVPNFESK